MPEESTTPDLVEVVTGLYEAANRGDWDAAISPYATNVIWETGDGITNVTGASGVRGLWEEYAGMFEDYTAKVETVVDLGNGVVYAVFHQEGRLAGSTGVVTETAAHIYEWVDGMVARVIVRWDVDEARAAAERLAAERGQAMSENVELVRRAYVLLSDLTDPDPNDPAIFEVAFVHGPLDEEFELSVSQRLPGGGIDLQGQRGICPSARDGA